MKRFKTILVWFLIIYAFFFIADYSAVWKHGTREACQHWMKNPFWIHFIMPGIGNGCIDFGYWP